ncbi:GreA/GreB family elongation factor [Streptomyces sp. NPDC058739]|uniref:GreA/GreB family elongation factor n=1 Tax=Streptomyces sp. NPDC058739 TaxID=3346618 RepID=UPI00369DBD51
MTEGPQPIGAEARRALEKELADLEAERRTVAETLRGSDSDEVGDLADQADELQRADQLHRLDARIEEVTLRLRQGTAAGSAPTDVVGVGSTVAVRFSDGSEQTVEIGEVAVAMDESLVTADSPLGGALLGHRVGDTVTYPTPGGQDTATIVSLGGS